MKYFWLKYRILFFIAVLTWPGCKSNLDVKPDNRRTPVTVEDYTAILNGEGWSRQIPLGNGFSFAFLEFLTMDVDDARILHPDPDSVDFRVNYEAFYTWRNHYDFSSYDDADIPSNVTTDTWAGLYRIIQADNIIIDANNKIEGNEADKQFLLGDAHFSRAMAFYYLVNIWGTPFDPAVPDAPMGIPINTSSKISTVPLQRNTVYEVYNQIISDLNAASSYIQRSGKSSTIFHYSRAAIYLLLSRIYLYMQHWEPAADFADKCLQINASLKDITLESTSINNPYTTFFSPANPEVIFTFNNNAFVTNNQYIFGLTTTNSFRVSSTLLGMYENGDCRPAIYFYASGSNHDFITPKTYTSLNGAKNYCYALRTSEAYLNRAEANAHLGKNNLALQDILLLRQHRIKNAPPIQPTTPALLLQAILLERRKEFAFQTHNWFDLRRTGMPALTHLITPIVDGSVLPIQKFVLKKNDPGYTVEIPRDILLLNHSLQPLGLPVRQPE